MKNVIAVVAVLLALGGAQTVQAQDWGEWGDWQGWDQGMFMWTPSPMFYDPYIVLPGLEGGLGIDVGIVSPDAGEMGDWSDVYVMGKYAITDKLEAGARLTTGLMNEGRDTFSDVVVGWKYGLTPMSAVTANLAVFNEVDEVGVSAGYMQAMDLGELDINGHLQLGFLDGYASEGMAVDLRVEPRYEFNEQILGYLGVLFSTYTEDIGDYMALNLWPNIDVAINENLILNGGVTFGVAGDMKQDEVGIRAAAIYLLPLE